MTEALWLVALLDSLKHPLLFADTQHIIRYMNKAAEAHYDRGRELIGTSLLDCHNADSQKIIQEIFRAMQQGLEERKITDNESHRVYMRAVRDKAGSLLGYYERYEPPHPS
jgi:DUF438 domain-containing protein